MDEYECGKTHTAPDKADRLGYVDSLKGFTIVCVVLGHVVDKYAYFLDEAHLHSAEILKLIYDALYLFHMPLFMMVSGFLFGKSYYMLERSLLRNGRFRLRLCNFSGLYFAYSIAAILSGIIFSDYIIHKNSLKDFILLFAVPQHAFWYLYVLIFIYLLFSASSIRSIPAKVMFPVLLFLNLVVSHRIGGEWFALGRTFFHLLFFYSGVLLFRENHDTPPRKFAVVIYGIASFILGAAQLSKHRLVPNTPYTKTVIALGLSLLFFFCFKELSVLANCRLLQLFGRYSLEIYLIHSFLIAGLRPIILLLGIEDICASVILNSAFSLFVPVIFSLLCKKIGCYDLFFAPASFCIKLKDKPRTLHGGKTFDRK